MSNIFSIVLLSTIIALITVSCNNDVTEIEEENYPLVSGDSAAIIMNLSLIHI